MFFTWKETMHITRLTIPTLMKIFLSYMNYFVLNLGQVNAVLSMQAVPQFFALKIRKNKGKITVEAYCSMKKDPRVMERTAYINDLEVPIIVRKSRNGVFYTKRSSSP